LALDPGLQLQALSGVPLLGISQLPLDRPLNRLLKRAMDIVGGLAGALVAIVLGPLFALAVYLESPGPLFEKQRRMSRGGRPFNVYKIRTTRPASARHFVASRPSGESRSPRRFYPAKEDPKPLRFGRFMQRWAIDELPQFWNLLIGDMSLVGPCPERPELVERFKDEIPDYQRHEVRAGLTGWGQTRGLQRDCDLIKRVEADLSYLENWSVMVDLSCIMGTFFRAKHPR